MPWRSSSGLHLLRAQSVARWRRSTFNGPAMVEASSGKVAWRVSLTKSHGERRGFQQRRSLNRGVEEGKVKMIRSSFEGS
jgi:hypothetical protein